MRFRVALSFPGEHRDFVRQVAAALSAHLGRDKVLYDHYYEAEFARPNLDTDLQRLYHDESELIAVFLCADYERKEWCGLEWRAIRDLIKKGRNESVMPLRFDMTEIPGLFSGDGYVWIPGQSPERIAELILERLDGRKPVASMRPQRLAPSRLPNAAPHLFGREAELARLEAAWHDPATHVVTIVAWGGVGKTALVGAWAAALAARDFDGADYFDWSFYSQGTREQGGASGETFINAALQFFGDPELAASPASPWDKGARLAQLVAERRALLILDGLEPLQHPPGPLAGQLKDPGVLTLLKGLAQRNPGLCVVTTRESVSELARFRESTAPEWKLDHLATPAGVELLKTLGVRGTTTELERLVEDVKGHALTLNLFGSYLRDAHGGDIRKRDLVDLHEADEEMQGGHAFRVMAAYERWFESEGETGQRALAVLRLLGLFDRPASAGCLEALRKEPIIPNLTEPIVRLTEAQWNLTLARLTRAGLIARPAPSPAPAGEGWGEGQTLDAHPLLREYFAQRLRDENAEGWKAAHSRLFDYLCESTEYQPDTLEGLQPLYQAVAHGCWAGRQEEARASVYRDRILRGTGLDGFYSTKKLGAFGADLGAVACFSEALWNRACSALTEVAQAWLLNAAAFHLRALGRLAEALEPMRAGLELRITQQDWRNAAANAGNLSELELTLGDVPAALRDAEQSVTFSDRSEKAFQRISKRSTLADALHQAGCREEARTRFEEAERMQAERQPEYPLLYSLQGFRYCELLLEGAERAAWAARPTAASERSHMERGSEVEASQRVIERASRTLAWATTQKFLLDIALDHLTLGRAAFCRAVLEPSSTFEASAELAESVAGLRRAGDLPFLPRGLLTRAWLRAYEGDEPGARADLDEAEEIASRGPMPLYLADIALHRARLFRDKAALTEARRLIEKHGYWRRKEELEDAEAAAVGWG